MTRSARRRLARSALVGLAVVLGVVAAVAVPRISRNLSTPHPGREVAAVQDDPRPGELDPNTVPQDGADYARMVGDRFLVCDREADDNLVKGVVHVEGATPNLLEVADIGGADGGCASITVTERVISLYVCERNVVAWHCSNAQSPVALGG